MKLIRSCAVILGLGLSMAVGASAAQACTLPANATAYATQMAQGLNAARAQNGLRALRFNRTLARAAAGHACDMQRNGFFSHTGSDGSGSFDRIRRAGVNACRTAENIALGFPTAAAVINDWMNSPSHRPNMLQVDVRDFGIGLADAPGGPIAVLVFSRDC